jgi:threonine synthase
MEMEKEKLVCWTCGKEYLAELPKWKCDCGGLLNVKQKTMHFSKESILKGPFSLWRYKEALTPILPSSIVSLGEGCTPLVSPTGSFKDRGATFMVSKIKELGINRVVEDSSGNAAASISAYCARGGIRCDIYSPEGTSPGKLRQTQSYGASLHIVKGSREDTSRVAEEAAEKYYYASHQKNPFFNAIGGGGMLLGSYLGFKQLLISQEISRLPKMFGIQAEACAPVHQAFVAGKDATSRVEKKPTIAEGISIVNPVRGAEILRAVRETGGAVEAVSEEEIRSTVKELALKGIYVEPTSGVAPAALKKLFAKGLISLKESVVIALTGSGLKTG